MLAQRKRSQGFSLMELMIVVVITGILAAIAIPTFISYVQKSRTSEATQFLGVIKLKQEAYRSEFGGYYLCDAANNMTDFAYLPGDETKMKGGAQFNLVGACFTDLGAKPDGSVRFGYAWIAGPPAVPNDVSGALGLAAADFDHYFVAHAISDLDGDGTAVVFEISNFTRNIYIMDKAGAPLAAGWE